MRIAVCDDQKEHQNILIEYINEYMKCMEDDYEIKAFVSGEEIVKRYAKEEMFDIIFLDMYMKEMNGIATAQKIRELDDSSFIVFVTSDPNYSLDAFRVDAEDYIVKPIDRELFYKIMDKVVKKFHRIESVNKKTYIVSRDGFIMPIKFIDIEYVESCDRKVNIVTEKEEIMDNNRLKVIENRFLENDFIRIGRFQIVNFHHVMKWDNDKIELKSGKILNVGRYYKKIATHEYGRKLVEREI